MKTQKILVTGDREMILRHNFLFEAMGSYYQAVDYLPVDSKFNMKALKNFVKSIQSRLPLIPLKPASSLRKNSRTYIEQSCYVEQRIRKLNYSPDLVFQLYGMFSPFWQKLDIPYTYYLDYTMALAKQNWSPWAPFKLDKEYVSWTNCERKAYQNAKHLFTYSNCVKSSLIEYYGINSENITVVTPSGQFQKPYQGEKTFGSKQILFNGSHFERKGGDILLNAFRKVKQAIPEAKLIIIGNKLPIKEDGVSSLGHLSWPLEMEKLFLETDLVVSPARCEPLGQFLIEAMNYGIPCVVTDQDGMPEIIKHQVNGIVLEPQNLDMLASKIIDLLSNCGTLEKMSKAARTRVEEQLNWQIIASKISQVIESL
ncbi:glycosyltransferase family 4 protein [Gloeocapsopsis crepidinum LEGE 06123]|uniref:Glycosyltransferase family 4 protein n=2 Tax=Gloeocapsopsis crepidinum TaxID=693223 RepID=A0ABR9UKK4_9CHRO|nr:glycosyltransferase family 4 protein [Gloeocapsopsis crepidinum LEGE 06123]